jgi:predicted transposase YdaD
MLIEHVIRKLAENHESIQKKVGDLMGGQVLDLDIIRIKHEAEAIGEKKGRAEGKAEGRAEGKVEEKENGIRILIQDNLEEGKSEEVILEKLMRRYDLKESEAR